MFLAQWHSLCPLQGHPTKTWKEPEVKKAVLSLGPSPFFSIFWREVLHTLLRCPCFMKDLTRTAVGVLPVVCAAPEEHATK